MANLLHALCDFELVVLRDYAKPIPIGHGAAFNAASEALKGMGYLDAMPYRINDKGRALLAEIDNPTPAATPVINKITREQVSNFHNSIDDYNSIDFYQRIATMSAIYPGKGTPFGLMYAALGLAEAGEVQNKVKKAFRDDGVIEMRNTNNYGTYVNFAPLPPERRAQIIKELGGALWYLSAVCNEIGATLSEVALTNLEELCGRTERDTLRGDGDDR